MGQRDGFSSLDVAKLNAMYGCNKANIGTGSSAPVASAGKPQRPARPSRPVKRPNGGGPTGAQVVGFIGNLIGAAFGDNETTTEE